MSIGFRETTIDVIELPQDIPAGMPYAIDDCSVAHRLGFRNKVMWGILLNTRKQYEVFEIPKKKGMRVIHAPNEMMKLLLQNIHVKFLDPMHRRLGPHVTAYRTGRSAKDAVNQHLPECEICDASAPVTPKKHLCPRKGLYIKMDMKDFFHTTSRAWVRNYFKSIGYSHTVSGILAGLLIVADVPGGGVPVTEDTPPADHPVLDTEEGQQWYTRTPQGSPASGAICNLVADQRLDPLIFTYLESLNSRYSLTGDWRWRYTRYSDDMVFTCGINPPENDCLNIIEDLQNVIIEAGYRVNEEKTTFTHSYNRRSMLGIVFNDKPNYGRAEYLRLRAITHNCATQGFESQLSKAKQLTADAMIDWLRGNINWVTQVNPDRGHKLLDEFKVALAIHENKNVK